MTVDADVKSKTITCYESIDTSKEATKKVGRSPRPKASTDCHRKNLQRQLRYGEPWTFLWARAAHLQFASSDQVQAKDSLKQDDSNSCGPITMYHLKALVKRPPFRRLWTTKFAEEFRYDAIETIVAWMMCELVQCLSMLT